MTSGQTIAALGIALILFVPQFSQAEQRAPDRLLPTNVRLLLPACPDSLVDQASVVESLQLELVEDGITVGSDRGDVGRTLVISVDALSCEDPRMNVVVRQENGVILRAEDVDLSDRPVNDRSRLLALALAEILRTLGSDSATVEGGGIQAFCRVGCPEDSPFVDALTGEVLRRTRNHLNGRSDQPGLLADVTVGTRSCVSYNGMGFGGRLGLSFRPAERLPLRLGFDGGYRFDEGADELGLVKVHAAFGGLSVLADAGTNIVRGEFGLRIELGWAWAQGHPIAEIAAGRSVNGFTLTPTARCALRIRITDFVWLMADFEVGYVVVGVDVTADGRRVGGIGGATLAASLGIAFGPSAR